jgi:hypothetical protein
MNLTITIPENWQKHSFEKWMYNIEMKLKKQRYQEIKEYPEKIKSIKVNFELIKN